MMVLGGVEDVGDFLAVERKWMANRMGTSLHFLLEIIIQ